MMEFGIFGSMTKLNFIGKGKANSKGQKRKDQKNAQPNFVDGEPTSTKTEEGLMGTIIKEVKNTKDHSQITSSVDVSGAEKGKSSFKSFFDVDRLSADEQSHIDSPQIVKKDSFVDGNTLEVDDEEVESRDKFEMSNVTFYKVLTKSFYNEHLENLKPFRKNDSGLKSSTKREKKTTRSLRERKLVISSPQNFHRVENEFTIALRKEAVKIGTLKKSASLENLLRDSDDFSNRLSKLEKGKLAFGSVQNLSVPDPKSDSETDISTSVLDKRCFGCGGFHSVPADARKGTDVIDDAGTSESEDSEPMGNENNLVVMREMSQSTPELLKSINQVPKDRAERPAENRFPLDDDVEVRKKSSIRTNRLSKTTDFDAGRRRQTSPINPKNFEIRGIMKIELASKAILTKWKEEYIAYENENFYRINEKTKNKELLASNVIIKSVKYPKSKESKEVELKDSKNVTYMLHFQELKYAKQFMENEKVQVYIVDNKVTIKKTLLRFLGRRSSREILERKGIYKNEPIYGNTLKDIYNKSGTNSLVPAFIYEVIKLLEKPENIKSLGVYRTSGNLATIQKIRFEVDNGRLGILSQYAKDPDVLTGSLKLFFRELKEPLIFREVCDKLLEFARLDLKQVSSKDHQKIRSILIKNLHEANLETFVVIMRHLLEVVKYKEYNKMDSYNLAICWGPSIIFSVHGDNFNPTVELSRDIVTQSQDATRLVDFFLQYYEFYPAELATLGKRQRPESIAEKIQSLRRQDSRDSVGSFDSNKSQKKSASSLSLSVDEITKKLVEFIEPHVACEGLYRKSGSSDKTNRIMKKLNKKKINELDKYKNDVHDLTDALKKYLKEQDPLITEETVELVLKASPDCSQSCLEPSTRRKVISLIEDNPKKDTLIFLIRHLAKVLEYQERTYSVPKNDLIYIWTNVLHNQKKCRMSNEDFAKFLAVSVTVFNDNLPDVVRSSLNNNGSTPNRNESMDELMKEMKHHQQVEKDRNSRYDNVDSDVGEASILDDKTEQTKL